jgi:hypothetical protein
VTDRVLGPPAAAKQETSVMDWSYSRSFVEASYTCVRVRSHVAAANTQGTPVYGSLRLVAMARGTLMSAPVAVCHRRKVPK